MPDFWQFPTVSMGLGPISAIYQAKFLKYLNGRGLADTAGRKVWAFMGDGEMDEPESLGAIDVAGREKLDNLIFVINCNLQRLDGPVRGNGKIIQEFESVFRGAGWNVIKVVWGRKWDELLARDRDGALVSLMNNTADGDFQTYKSEDGAFVREHFFGRDPRTGPSSRWRLQLTTKVRLSSSSREASVSAPTASTSRSASSREAHSCGTTAIITGAPPNGPLRARSEPNCLRQAVNGMMTKSSWLGPKLGCLSMTPTIV